MNKIRKTPAGLDCPIVLSEECVAVDDDNVCTPLVMADKDILEFVQSSKNIIDADSEDKNEMNNATPVPTSSKMINVVKNNMLTKYQMIKFIDFCEVWFQPETVATE
ncbi:hypothetical protein TNCV_5008491 [Trichonephila clavipes]|nr:hypothetical protein TNCV_5008491 [Trichonephila clavipes]